MWGEGWEVAIGTCYRDGGPTSPRFPPPSLAGCKRPPICHYAHASPPYLALIAASHRTPLSRHSGGEAAAEDAGDARVCDPAFCRGGGVQAAGGGRAGGGGVALA